MDAIEVLLELSRTLMCAYGIWFDTRPATPNHLDGIRLLHPDRLPGAANEVNPPRARAIRDRLTMILPHDCESLLVTS